MIEGLLARTANQDFGFLSCFDRFGGVAVAEAEGVAIENVIGEILLKIIFWIVLQHQPHIADGDERKFGVAEESVVYAEDERNFFAFVSDRFNDRLEMVANDFWSVGLVCGG